MPTLKNKPPKRNSVGYKSNTFYDSIEWKRARHSKLRSNPLCEHCGRKATAVDHIHPMRLGGYKTDSRNLQSLCNSCHKIKTAMDRKKYRKEYKKL